jgi:histidinol-phosphatase (PHP family)
MLTDYHTHSFRCGHAAGTMREYVEAAIARGIDEIGLTDHIYLYFEDDHALRDPSYAMAEHEYPLHVEEMLALREEFEGRIAVRISVEADYIRGRESDLQQILGRFPYDYVLGSVHFVDGWAIDAPEHNGRWKIEGASKIWRRYFEELEAAVRSGMFDLLAHIDLPKKFGFYPDFDIEEPVSALLETIARSGCAVELSSAGLRKPVGEMYPSPSILARLRERAIPIALSSDAHAPHEVGDGLATLVAAARAAGHEEIVTFEQRRMIRHPLGTP